MIGRYASWFVEGSHGEGMGFVGMEVGLQGVAGGALGMRIGLAGQWPDLLGLKKGWDQRPIRLGNGVLGCRI